MTLIFAFIATGIVALSGAIFVRQLRHSLVGSIDDGLLSRAAPVVQALRTADTPDSRVLGSLLVSSREALGQVIGADGRVVAASPGARRLRLYRPGQGRYTVVLDTYEEDEPIRAIDVPVARADATWHVVVGASLESAEAAGDRVRTALFAAAALVAILGSAGAWILAGAALRPVERMRSEVAELASSPGEGKIAVPGTHDELSRLAVTMNRLLAADRHALETQRQFVSDASHELRTPLSVLRTELELASQRGRTREELADAVSNAAQEVERLARLAQDLLLLARVDEGASVVRATPTPVPPLLAEAARAAGGRAAGLGISVRVHAPDELVAWLDRDQLRRAIDNLVDNALTFSVPGGTIELICRVESGTLVLEVRDEGPGFPNEFLPHAFDRFRRADVARSRAAGGAGLGLAIVRAIASLHGGTATAENRAAGGAVVSIGIPLSVRDVRRAPVG